MDAQDQSGYLRILFVLFIHAKVRWAGVKVHKELRS